MCVLTPSAERPAKQLSVAFVVVIIIIMELFGVAPCNQARSGEERSGGAFSRISPPLTSLEKELNCNYHDYPELKLRIDRKW